MLLTYVTDKSFGPSGGFAGYFLMGVGVFTIFLSISGAVLLLLGSFMAFSASGCSVDVDHFRIRFTNNLWGFIKVGKWQYVHRKMQLGLSHARMAYQVHSLSNRTISVTDPDWRVNIYDGEKSRKGKTICKFKNRDDAEEALARLSELLDLSIRNEKLALG